jgi:hypothetical protein
MKNAGTLKVEYKVIAEPPRTPLSALELEKIAQPARQSRRAATVSRCGQCSTEGRDDAVSHSC